MPPTAVTTAIHCITCVMAFHSSVVVGALISAIRAETADLVVGLVATATPPPGPDGTTTGCSRSSFRLRTITVTISAQPAASAPRMIVVMKKWNGTTGVFHAGTVTSE